MPRKRTPDERLAQTRTDRIFRTAAPATTKDALRLLRSHTLNGHPVRVTAQRQTLAGQYAGHRFRIRGGGLSFSIPPHPRDAYKLEPTA